MADLSEKDARRALELACNQNFEIYSDEFDLDLESGARNLTKRRIDKSLVDFPVPGEGGLYAIPDLVMDYPNYVLSLLASTEEHK